MEEMASFVGGFQQSVTSSMRIHAEATCLHRATMESRVGFRMAGESPTLMRYPTTKIINHILKHQLPRFQQPAGFRFF
jgi:hypothetical protein